MEELLKNHLFATHAVAAVGSVMLGTLVTYPLDTVKTLLQVGSGSSKILTTTQVLKRVQKFSGNSGLYSGMGSSILGRISGVGTRFGIYEILTAYCKDGRDGDYVKTPEAFFAGVAAGFTESLIFSPFELIKLRAQVTSAFGIPSSTSISEGKAVAPLMSKLLRGYSPDMRTLNQSVGLLSTLTSKHPNMISALKEHPWMISGGGRPPSVADVRKLTDIISLEGCGALWRGLQPGLIRDSMFGGIFFSSWHFILQGMINWKAVHMNPIPRNNEDVGPLSPLAISITAGIAGSMAAAASHCFDTAKSRSQCTVFPKYMTMERRFLKWKRPGNRFECATGMHPADRKILFCGLGIRAARSGFTSFIIVGTYFLAIHPLI